MSLTCLKNAHNGLLLEATFSFLLIMSQTVMVYSWLIKRQLWGPVTAEEAEPLPPDKKTDQVRDPV